MNPDVPIPSIEQGQHPESSSNNAFASFRDRTASPLASSSPNRTPFKTPLSHPATPAAIKSPRSPSLSRNDIRSSPYPGLKRSSSSLSVSRGQTPKVQLRRVSSNLNPASPDANMKSYENAPRLPMTAESVARDYFLRELEAQPEAQSKTVVIVHDSCYGHRFSRPRTSKAALSTIVERPERIHASLLGASTAYVRLGDRHADGASGPHPNRDVTTVPQPPFLLKKTKRSIALDHPAVTHIHGTKWMEELQIMCDSAESRLAMNGKELQRPIGYGKDEQGNNLPKLHEGDLYLSAESLAALQGCLGGVCDAVDMVFSSFLTQRAFVCIRPPGHHCSSNYPSGFCWLNNVHVGISYAAMNHGLTHAAIIDFDLHHGDGSQDVTWDHNRKAQNLPKNTANHKKTPIGYYSLHDINSYPCEWGDEDKVRNASLCIENAHGQSIWNVHLEPWNDLDHFWQLYKTKYTVLLEKAKSFLLHHSDRLRGAGIEPKAAIFLSAGFDASQWEGQGMQRHNVNVPTEFYAKLTSDIVKLASQTGLGVNGRVISVLEGGYSDRALTSGVLSHLCGLSGNEEGDLTNSEGLQHTMSAAGMTSVRKEIRETTTFVYDSAWWHESNLAMLEDRVAGNLPPPPKKEKTAGNYSSPTQASNARMTNVARERRSLSAQLEARLSLDSVEVGPPPAVDWVTASYELSRILIPDDRQTLSCTHPELNAEATKARKERQSAIGIPSEEPRMQLRTRGKGAFAEPEAVRTASRTSNRRTTIAAVSELPDPSMVTQRPRRRSSAASSILSTFQDMKLNDGNASSSGHANVILPTSTAPNGNKELAAKKTRMGPPARKTGQRTSSPKKAKEAKDAVGSGSKIAPLKDRLLDYNNATTGSVSATQSRASSNEQQAAENSMDELTNGIKKVSIKLNMPTPQQHAENQRKAEEAKGRKPRASRKASVPKLSKAKPSPVSATNDDSGPVRVAETGVSTFPAQAFATSDLQGGLDGQNTVETDSTQVHADQTGGSLLSGDSSPYAQFVSARFMAHDDNIDGHNTLPVSVRDSARVAPGSDETQMNGGNARRSKADLPLFTSSSPIPFAGERKSYAS